MVKNVIKKSKSRSNSQRLHWVNQCLLRNETELRQIDLELECLGYLDKGLEIGNRWRRRVQEEMEPGKLNIFEDVEVTEKRAREYPNSIRLMLPMQLLSCSPSLQKLVATKLD